MIGFDIRNVNSKDYNEIIKLRESLKYPIIKPIEDYKSTMIFIAQLNDDIIGYINFTIFNSTSIKNILIVNEIIVQEKYRNLGVGHELIKEAYSYWEYYNAIWKIAIYNNYKNRRWN